MTKQPWTNLSGYSGPGAQSTRAKRSTRAKEATPVRPSRESEPETPVIFRAQMEAGTLWITAVFPCEPATLQGDTFTIYQHIGQHGAGSLGWYQRTRAAKPEEYADLKRELESAPYGYRFKVYARMTRAHRATLRAEAKRLRDMRA